MKCTNCGGIISFKNGQGKCESCGALHNIDYFFENTEVFLCYVENDSAGRRTKDSFIASDIYGKLESKKVNTFFERVSVDNTIGEDLEAVRHQAITKAKIVIVIGTAKEYFDIFQKKYADDFQDKTIIPVYSGIKPELLPDELKKLQALNYDSVGSTVDLVKTVLKKLGREEAELETIRKESKKKKVILLSILAFLLVVAAVVFIVWFSQNKKPENDVSGENVSAEQTDTPETEEPIQNRYERAVSLLESGNYIEALSELKQIREFRDSEDLIKTTYNKYSGYYQTGDLNSSLYLNIKDGKSAEIKFEQLSNGVRASFADTVLFDGNVIDLIFNDSFGKASKATITLDNRTISLIAKSNEEIAGEFVWDTDLTFNLSDRTDRPLEKEVTKEIIMQWMNKQTTLSEITQEGFIVESDGNIYSFRNHEYPFISSFNIKNSNVKIICVQYDLKKMGEGFWYCMGQFEQTEDLIVYGVIAPAELLLSEKIGTEVVGRSIIVEEPYAYVPFSDRINVMGGWGGNYAFQFVEEEEYQYTNAIRKIEPNTGIGIASRVISGNDQFKTFLEDNGIFS